jgi:predicted amidohydrolase
MIVALASPRLAASVDECLERVRDAVVEAAARGSEVVCFPEAYLPGLRGLDFEVPPFGPADQERAVAAVAGWAKAHRIVTVLGTEWHTPAGRHIAAVVFAADGTVQGVQTKTQIAPSEDPFYVPGRGRRLFEANGVRFGVVICHEGFRYPETVRWAAVRGAKVVFHPHCTGGDRTGQVPARWCDPDAPYYEKAQACRALENGVYLAGVNYGFRFPESATSLIGPGGECLARLPYGEAGVLVAEFDPAAATGLYAARYAPDRYGEDG